MFLTPLLTIALSLTSVSARNCRCTSASRCWPSDSEFKTLASKVSQSLIHPVPPATPCYDSAAGNCTDVLTNWQNSIWRSDKPGAAELTNYETYTFPNGTIQGCYLNATLGIPCQQGNVPVIGVDARTPEDIQEAVRFAGNHNLRLVIKNTGCLSHFFTQFGFLPADRGFAQTRLSWKELCQGFVLNMDPSYEGHHFSPVILSHRCDQFGRVR